MLDGPAFFKGVTPKSRFNGVLPERALAGEFIELSTRVCRCARPGGVGDPPPSAEDSRATGPAPRLGRSRIPVAALVGRGTRPGPRARRRRPGPLARRAASDAIGFRGRPRRGDVEDGVTGSVPEISRFLE